MAGNSLPAQAKLSPRDFLRIFFRFLPFIRPYWLELGFLIVIYPLTNAILVVIGPLCSKLIIDDAFPRKDMGLLTAIAVVGFFALIFGRIFVFLRATVASQLEAGVMSALGPRFYSKMLDLDMSYHERTPVGEKIFRCDTDLLDSADMIGSQFPQMVQNVYKFLIVLVTMWFLDWRPVVLGLLVAPLMFVVAQLLYNFYRRIDQFQRLKSQELTTQIERSLTAPAVVYSHAAKRHEGVRYYAAVVRYSIANMYFWFMREVTLAMVWPSEMPSVIVTMVIGLCGYWVVMGQMTVGEWTALSAYIIQLIVPLGMLVTYYQNMRLRMVAAERMLGILDRPSKVTVSESPADVEIAGEIEFRNVTFAYQQDRPVLKNVSFKIRRGTNVAFVGPSGSGKSTLVNLMLRFYDPDEGEVLVDGRNLRGVNLRAYRGKTGIVLQEPVLFDRSIRENVLYGASSGDSDIDLQRAATISGLNDVIARLPEGFDSQVSQSSNLSLGEKQRISVARCVAGNPRLLLLDEPTSLLDPDAQHQLAATISQVSAGRTTVFVSHDLTTLAAMDCIVFMRDGQILESGTHDELVQAQGAYWRAWQLQCALNAAANNN